MYSLNCTRMACLYLCSILFLLAVCHPGGCSEADMEDRDWEWGSGLQELLHFFPAESPFATEMPVSAVNCTQRFRLPPLAPGCWEDIAGPEEFEKTRLLVHQNQAALQAMTEASDVEEGGATYEQQAMEDVQGVREDHLSVSLTVDYMQKVFFDLEEKRKDGKERHAFFSLKEQIANTMDSINSKEQMAAYLEQHLSNLEKTLDAIQHRLNRLLAK